MKQYEVTAAFWREGNLVPAGTELMLSDVESKYIRHILKEVQPEAPAPVTVVADHGDFVSEATVEDGVITGTVVTDRKPKRRKD